MAEEEHVIPLLNNDQVIINTNNESVDNYIVPIMNSPDTQPNITSPRRSEIPSMPHVNLDKSNQQNNNDEYPLERTPDMSDIIEHGTNYNVIISPEGVLSPPTVLSPEPVRVKNNGFVCKWDGSYLGEYDRDIIEWELKTKRGKYCQLTINEVPVIAQIRTIKSSLPCIIDEIKPLFGLVKMGSHHLYLGKTMYQIIKPLVFKSGGLQEDYRLDEILSQYQKSENLPEDFVKNVQKTYMFRNVLGIPQNFDRSINVRIDNNIMHPISFTESRMEPHNYKPLSKAAIKRWFNNNDDSLDILLRDMLNIEEENDFEIKMPMLRIDIDNIISRINREYVMFTAFIITNIHNKIDSLFNRIL